MIIFGPFRAIPKNMDFKVFNLSSLTQIVDKLPGLIPPSNLSMNYIEADGERSFDMWYYDYVLNDPIACSSLMSILKALDEGNNIYICIYDYESDPYISMINEAFMKILQSRYELKYAIINEPSDIEYVDRDGCDFAGVNGIKNFDDDMKRYMELSIAEKTMGRSFINIPGKDFISDKNTPIFIEKSNLPDFVVDRDGDECPPGSWRRDQYYNDNV